MKDFDVNVWLEPGSEVPGVWRACAYRAGIYGSGSPFGVALTLSDKEVLSLGVSDDDVWFSSSELARVAPLGSRVGAWLLLVAGEVPATK